MKKVSTRFSLKVFDLIKGLIMGVGTPVLYYLQEYIPHWDAQPILKVFLSALITYLIKNFFTDDVKTAAKTFKSQNLSVVNGIVYDENGNVVSDGIVGGRPNDRP